MSKIKPGEIKILLQQFGEDRGYTDIEIQSPDFHLIIEAKRGWILPHQYQIQRYIPRFNRAVKRCVFVTMSECSADFASINLAPHINGIKLVHISWRMVRQLCRTEITDRRAKHLVNELDQYLNRIVTMQNKESNWVYVVSLSSAPWTRTLSFIDVVEQMNIYFHPFAESGWPKEPPNYIGFRYGGRLRSIRHIESASVITNFHPYFAEKPNIDDRPHFFYKLGPAISPQREVKTGNIYRGGRKWAMLDLLLTCGTIHEASEKSAKRVGGISTSEL